MKDDYKDNMGRFGIYGGQYVPEPIVIALEELEKVYLQCRLDKKFWHGLEFLLKEYAGRPSKLHLSRNMTKDLGGAKIYLKREDLNYTGSYKINNALGNALLTKRMGKKRIIAESTSGRHGAAVAAAAALFDLKCEIFLAKEDTRYLSAITNQIEFFGAKANIVTSGAMLLKDAINEAMCDWSRNLSTTHYAIGSAIGPHPFPTIVRDFQRVIGLEAKDQIVKLEGKLPSAVVASIGGGSGAIGAFFNFIENENVRLIGCEGAGKGPESGFCSAAVSMGEVGVFHGMKSYFCQDKTGIGRGYSVASGLSYPGIGPELALLHDTGRAEIVGITDDEAINAFKYLSRIEGIIPSLETSHAVAHVMNLARSMKKDDIIILCISGGGDRDISDAARYREGDLL